MEVVEENAVSAGASRSPSDPSDPGGSPSAESSASVASYSVKNQAPTSPTVPFDISPADQPTASPGDSGGLNTPDIHVPGKGEVPGGTIYDESKLESSEQTASSVTHQGVKEEACATFPSMGLDLIRSGRRRLESQAPTSPAPTFLPMTSRSPDHQHPKT